MTAATPAQREDFVEFQRKATSAEDAARSLEAVYGFDVAARLAAIEAPVRVLHRREDRAIPFRLGQDLAARIPDATFVALGGADHFPWLGAALARRRGRPCRPPRPALNFRPAAGRARRAPGRRPRV